MQVCHGTCTALTYHNCRGEPYCLSGALIRTQEGRLDTLCECKLVIEYSTYGVDGCRVALPCVEVGIREEGTGYTIRALLQHMPHLFGVWRACKHFLAVVHRDSFPLWTYLCCGYRSLGNRVATWPKMRTQKLMTVALQQLSSGLVSVSASQRRR